MSEQESVNIYEAKTRLSQLVDKAASGVDVTFDRMLIAQARSEPLVLLTSDSIMRRYGAPVRLV